MWELQFRFFLLPFSFGGFGFLLRYPGSWHGTAVTASAAGGVKAVPREGERWAKWSQDRSGNGNIKYRNFTTPFWSTECLPVIWNVYIFLKSQTSLWKAACICVSGGGGLCCSWVHLAKVPPLSSTQLSSGVGRAGLGSWHGWAVSGGVGPEELPEIRRLLWSCIDGSGPLPC